MGWKIKDKLGEALQYMKEIAIAILKGQLLLRMNFGKYLLHIIWLFILLVSLIWFNIQIEEKLKLVEDNKTEIQNKQAIYDRKSYEIKVMTRRTYLSKKLKDMGSSVEEPVKPATELR